MFPSAFQKIKCCVLVGWLVAGSAFGGDVFDQRILPILKSPNPSSCIQCHLSSVDLKEYIRPSETDTFVSLRDQGLIDLENPKQSKILKLIKMGERDADAESRLIHEDTRKSEFEAFSAWIVDCCADPKLLGLPKLDHQKWAKPAKPDQVIRHSRKDRVLDSFVRNVWSQRMRCFPCHTPHELDENNPRHKKGIETRQQFAKKYGADSMKRLDLFLKSPKATLKSWIARSQPTLTGELPLINLHKPSESLVLLKPMSKIPQSPEARASGALPHPVRPLTHMGGLKLHKNDQSYKSIVRWIYDYSKVVHGDYETAKQIPRDNWHPSQMVLRFRNVPEEWETGMPVQMFVHAWNAEDNQWQESPIAFTQGLVTPRKIVNGALFLFAAENKKKKEAVTKPARGDYLIKIYPDLNGRLQDDPGRLLGTDDYFGQIELKNARWRETFARAEWVSGKNLIEE